MDARSLFNLIRDFFSVSPILFSEEHFRYFCVERSPLPSSDFVVAEIVLFLQRLFPNAFPFPFRRASIRLPLRLVFHHALIHRFRFSAFFVRVLVCRFSARLSIVIFPSVFFSFLMNFFSPDAFRRFVY